MENDPFELKKYGIRMKPGAPADEFLTIRVTTVRSYVPDPESYIDRSDTQYKDEGANLTDGTLLGMMVYDKTNIENLEFSVEEIFPDSSDDTHVWELVDGSGNVWTEYYEVTD